jgi:hypothetical protein
MKLDRYFRPAILAIALLFSPFLAPAATAADEGSVAADTGTATADVARTSVGGRRDVERHFDSLTIGELVYTNVWVHRQTNFNVLIRHAGGIHTIKLTDLPKAELDALRPQLGDLANIKEDKEPELVSRFKEMQESDMSAVYRVQFEEQFKRAEELFMTLLLPIIGGLVLLHFISSFFIYSLCKKTNTKPGFEVWLPFVNQTALLRAAGLPGVWALLGFMAPLIPVAVFTAQLLPPASVAGLVVVGISALFWIASGIVWIAWCFKICIARQKSGWLGILLLIPGVNVLTFTYLAFAD